mmetsp:Transcript_6350/g.9131  ORF Transcript_6350/g.9131 Transcript_6350/m.9131 type:complete len:507 (+) Transcript_6350:52-1572(+)
MGIIADFEYLESGKTCQTGATSNDDHFAPWWVALVVFSVCFVFMIMVYMHLRSFARVKQIILVDKQYEDVDTEEINKHNLFWFSVIERKMYPYMACQSFFNSSVGFSVLLCLIQLVRWYAVIAYTVFFTVIISGMFFWYPSDLSEKKRDEIKLERSSREALEPRNVYMDFSRPMEYVYLTFILQVMLTVVYVLSVLNSSDDGMPCFNQTWAYTLMWLTIGLRSIYFTLDYFYRSPNYLSDKTIWQNMRKVIEENEEPGGEKLMVTDDNTWVSIGYHKEITKFEYKFRYVLDLIMNGCVNHILTVLMVIQSANGNFTDFVLNFVAARFIIELDDYSTWNLDSKFWIVKNSVLKEQESKAQNDFSVGQDEESNQLKDSLLDEESNKMSDSAVLDEESSNQTHTNIQPDLSHNQSFANQDHPLSSQVKVQTLTHEVQTLTNEVQTHKSEGETLKNEVQSLKIEGQTHKHEIQTLTGEVQTLKKQVQALLLISRQEGIPKDNGSPKEQDE